MENKLEEPVWTPILTYMVNTVPRYPYPGISRRIQIIPFVSDWSCFKCKVDNEDEYK